MLDLYQISEGHRSYIILMTDIILRILAARKKLLVNSSVFNIFEKVKGTIIIDEFDKHLHPLWQRTFINTLKEEFPQIQFLLSTHNVVSLQSAEDKKIFVLNIEENGNIEIKDDIIPVGLDIAELYKLFLDEN